MISSPSAPSTNAAASANTGSATRTPARSKSSSFADGAHHSRTFAGDDIVASEVLPGLVFPASAVFAGYDGIE
jgi:hypothetical protein